jgi:hypothetical protein
MFRPFLVAIITITALNTQYHTTVRKEQKEQIRVDFQ